MRWYSSRIAPIVGIVIAVIASIAIGAEQFLRAEQDRELLRWQTQFAIIADGRKAVVESWLTRQIDAVQRLADNASVQIYAMGLSAADRRDRDPALQDYLRNLLDFAAQNDGFVDRQPLARIPANVRRQSIAGLLLLSPMGEVLAAGADAPAVDGELAAFIASLKPGDRVRVQTYLGPQETPVFILAVPVFAVHGGRTPDDHVGYVVGTKDFGTELFALLPQPGDPGETSETLLIAREGNILRYLSPRRDGATPMTRQLDMATPNLDAVYAVTEPGGFGEKVDYASRPVLVTGRPIAGTSWSILYKVDRSEVLGGIEERTRAFVVSFTLACLLAIVAIALAWALGASRKTRMLADAYRRSAEDLAENRNFLALLRDEDPSPTFVVTRQGRITFANAAFAAGAGIPLGDVIGKTVEQIFGTDHAQRFRAGIDEAFERRGASKRMLTLPAHGQNRFVQANHVYIPARSEDKASVLVIEDDITEIVTARERAHKTQALVIDALVSLIDRHDPTAKGHSGRLSSVAAWIAEAMGLGADEIEAIQQAAKLVNLGKALVPAELLNKKGILSADEIEILRTALERTHDMLASIDFAGPTLEIVRHCWENWDGNGRPIGLSGDAIHIGARIVRVANAFVAMMSTRPHRAAGTIEGTLSTLLAEADQKYDRRVVIALMHFFDNMNGRERWRQLSDART